LVFGVADFADIPPRRDGRDSEPGTRYVGPVVANFAWLWPILNGDPISNAHWQAELWLPS
jgi:hypothetical protein